MFENLKNKFKKPEEMSSEKKQSDIKHNYVLKYLAEKNIGQWTKESDVEKRFEGEIDNYSIRMILQRATQEGYLEFSRNMNEFLITNMGRAFFNNGGYK